jgi:glycyl-tRNA synthetase beta chain
VGGVSDFLLELLSEEIPARMQAKARDDLARLAATELAKAGLQAETIQTWSTPRRLALIARGLPLGTPAVSEELKGPRTSAPPQALEGFLRKTGLTQDQLTDRDGIWFAVIEKPGRATSDVLAEAIPAIIRAFPWPKSMRWGAASLSTESLRWVRPLQGVVAMLDEEVIDLEIGDVRSGAATLGHRFHHPGPITLAGASDYQEKLRACHVIVDQDERARIIRDGAAAAASAEGLTLVEDEGLVLENAGLTEWPVPLLGRFDPEFLEVPREVIQLTMRTNQKYFAATDGEGKLAPAFICVANIAASDGGERIVAGNQKVLAARLADARFFWEQDLKVQLEDQAKKLSQIVFHEKLGTVADKVERVAKLARWLVEEGIVTPSAPAKAGALAGEASHAPALLPSQEHKEQLAALAERAARLCKADLVTQMVGEFPELQGLIGGYLAEAQGEDPQVTAAIRDHYKPVGQGDEVPTAPVTVAVSLADKLDTIATFFAAEERPTGSKDPYALRRSALAVLSLLTLNQFRLPLSAALHLSCDSLFWQLSDTLIADETFRAFTSTKPGTRVLSRDMLGKLKSTKLAREELGPEAAKIILKILPTQIRAGEVSEWVGELLDFFADRLKVQQREAGVRHDLIDAVFALGGEDDLVRLLARVRALQAFVETPEGADLLAGYKRAANILKKEGWSSAPAKAGALEGGAPDSPALLPSQEHETGQKQLSYTPEPAETALIAALDSAEPEAAAAVEREDFAGAMKALATLRGPVDAFFNEVTVNDPDPAKREARLNLLARIRGAVHRVADFSRIEG